jgi:hypothetical protein
VREIRSLRAMWRGLESVCMQTAPVLDPTRSEPGLRAALGLRFWYCSDRFPLAWRHLSSHCAPDVTNTRPQGTVKQCGASTATAPTSARR